MESYEYDLDEALNFTRSVEQPKNIRDIWIEKLTKNLLLLDEQPRSSDRKRMVLATQSVIVQLEVLFDKEKPPILLLYNDDHDKRITDSFKAV